MAIGLLGVLAGATLSVLPAPTALAATGINKQINFQGKVTNANGTNVTNGSFGFVFKLYSVATGGTAIWTETKTLTVTDGVFQTNLGSTTALPGSVDFNTDNIYLGVNFNSDGEMTPRIQFTSVAQSFNSDLLDGLDSTAFAQLNPATAQSGSLNVTGSVQAATSLQAPLVDTATAVALNVGTATASSVTVGRATSSTNLTLQGSASTSWSATGASGTTTVNFNAPTANTTLKFPASAAGTYTICTTDATSCGAVYQAAMTGNYLAKNATDSSSISGLAAAAFGYTFNNTTSAPTTSGILKLDNNTNTGSTLLVTANATPGSGSALLKVNQANAAATGNLIDLQLNNTSQFAVDYAGNLTQNGGTATTKTVNGQTISATASFTGTVTAATSLNAPLAVLTGTAASSSVLTGRVTGDTNDRFALKADGGMNWGPGNAATDTNLYRSGVGSLKTDTALTVGTNFTVTAGATSLTGVAAGSSVAATVQTGAASNKGLVAKGAASQSANLLELQDANANVNGSFNAAGNQLTLGRIAASGTVTQGQLLFSDGTTSGFGTTLKTATLTTGSQTITLPDTAGAGGTVCLQNSSACGFVTGTAGSYIQNQSSAYQSAVFQVQSSSDTVATGVIESRASQTSDLLQFQSSSGGIVAGVRPSGAIYSAPVTTPSTDVPSNARLFVQPLAAGNTAIVARVSAGASPTGDIMQLQSANGSTNLFKVDVNGAATSASSVTGTALTATTGNVNATAGTLQTAGTNRIDNSGNHVNVGNITGTAGVTVATSGTGTGNALALQPASGSSLTAAVTKNAATGNEVGYDLGLTVNKATSGNYTGLKLNVTETAAPGTGNLLADFQAGGASKFSVTSAGAIAATQSLTITSAINPAAGSALIVANNTNGTPGGTNLIDLQVGGTSKFTVTSGGTATVTGNLILNTLDTANTATLLCRNSTNRIATCSSTGTGAAFVQGGNSFGAAADLGTNDAFGLNLRTGGTTRLTVSTSGDLTYASGAGGFDQSASTGTFKTGSGAVSLNGDTTVASGKSLTAGGSVLFQSNATGTSAFNVKSPASGTNGNVFTVDTQNGRVGVNLGGTNVPASTLDVNGSMRLYGTGTDSYTTPVGSAVPTKINIPSFDPGSFGQVLAFGLPSSAQSTARAMSLFDARTGSHQATFGVFAPDENTTVGFSWDGSNTTATLKTTDDVSSTDGLMLRSGTTSGSATTSGGVTLQSGDGLGTNSSSGNITIDAGAKTGTGTAGAVTIGGANASALTLGRSTLNTTVAANLAVQGTSANTMAGSLQFNGVATDITTASNEDLTLLAAGTGVIVLNDTVQVPTLAAANSATFLCRNSSNQLATCNTTGTGAAFTQGGNSFGAAGDLGTNDAFGLNLRTNNATRLTVSTSGDLTYASGTGGGDQSASTGTFKTGSGAVSLNGDTTVATGKNLNVANGIVTLGSAGAGNGTLVNNGGTVNTQYSMGNLTTGGWDAGGAAATVDKYTYIAAGQTTTGQTLTPPSPTSNTVYGKLLYITNTGTASFTMLGTVVTAGSTATLIWANVNGVTKWTFAGADASGILNQNTSDQTADFRISGTGRANTSLITPTVDSITGGLNIGTGTATGITIGGTNTTGTIGIGNSAASTINIGTGAQAHTIGIGTDTSSVQGLSIGSSFGASTTTISAGTGNLALNAVSVTTNQTAVNFMNSTVNTAYVFGAATSIAFGGSNSTVTLGNAGGTATLRTATGALTITSAAAATWSTAAGNLTVDSAATLNLGTSTATGVAVGKTGTTTTVNGTTQLGASAGNGALVNNGSTQNVQYSMGNLTGGGWDAGGAAATVDKYTYIAAGQTSTGQTLTPPSPTTTTAYGKLLYVTNTGTASFTMLGTVVTAGSTATLIWANVNGVAKWTFAGADASGILNQSTSDQSADFRISGTGRANTAFTGPLFDALSGGALNLGTSSATGITVGKTGITTQVAGTFQLGAAAGAGALVNNGTTLNSTLAIGNLNYSGSSNTGTIGTAAATVDAYTSFTIAQTTAGQTLTVPTPTAGAAASTGRVIYIANTGSATFTLGTGGASMATNSSATLVFNGSVWTFAGADGSGILNQTSADQTANFRISGTGVLGSGLQIGGTSGYCSTGCGNLNFAAGSNQVLKVLAAAAAANGNSLTIAAGTGGTGTTSGGDLLLQGGAAGSTGTVGGNVVVKSQTNSTTAFMVQNSSGTAVLTVDTSSGGGAGTVLIGDATNGAKFGTTNELTFSGTSRHAKTIKLTAEYAGAVLDAGGQSAVTGTMTAGFDSTNFVSFYKWTTSQSSAQTFDIVARIPIPEDWAAWNGNPTFRDQVSSTTTGQAVTVQSITNSSNAADSTFGSYTITPGTTATWTSFSANALAGTGYAAGGIMTVRIRVSAINNNSVQMGDITIPYLSRW